MIFTWTALLAVALADDVLLANGGRLAGVASEESGRWLVRTPHGDLALPKDAVHSVVPGHTLLHEYDDRLAALCGCPSADQVFELALWAQEQGLARYVKGLLATTLAIDPDHPDARCLLGYSGQGSRRISSFERDVRPALRPPARVPALRRRSIETTPYSLGIPLTPASLRYRSPGGRRGPT